jgi:hypothetical protein
MTRHLVVRFLPPTSKRYSYFPDLGQVKLNYMEGIMSVAPYTHAGTSCILVGTGVHHDEEQEARSGRILVFKANAETRTFKLEFSKDVEAGVSSIKQLKQRIIVAINDRVCRLCQKGPPS